jgi:hypothetical protein
MLPPGDVETIISLGLPRHEKIAAETQIQVRVDLSMMAVYALQRPIRMWCAHGIATLIRTATIIGCRQHDDRYPLHTIRSPGIDERCEIHALASTPGPPGRKSCPAFWEQFVCLQPCNGGFLAIFTLLGSVFLHLRQQYPLSLGKATTRPCETYIYFSHSGCGL